MSVRAACRLLAASLAAGASVATAAVELTTTETTWLKAAAPVIAEARADGLPLDIVVQPQDAPGLAPLAMAYVQQRCKLVLSMRGNADAQATLDRIEPALLQPVVEAIAAHEMAHCWRHVNGRWHRLPETLQEAAPDADAEAARREMNLARREEGFADLVALAWTGRHHPTRYADVHAWIARERATDVIDGSHHDTRAWLRIAPSGDAFAGEASMFDAAGVLWQRGLLEP
jgi:hypothetical protein